MSLHIDKRLFQHKVKYVTSRRPGAEYPVEMKGTICAIYLAEDKTPTIERLAPRIAIAADDGFIDDVWLIEVQSAEPARIPNDRDDHGVPIK